MTDITVQITAPHFCAGMVVRDGVVVEAAPIIKYMRGWTIRHVHGYCTGKSWTVDEFLEER